MTISAKVKFFVNNLIDGSGVGLASNVQNLLPLTNLQHPEKRKVWRGGATTNVQVTIDLQYAQSVDTLLLTRENLTAAGTIEWRYSADNFTTENIQAGILTVGAKPAGFDLVYPLLLDPAVSRRYWRVILTDTGNVDGYLEVGRLYLGLRTEFTAALQVPIKVAVVDTTQQQRSPSGAPLLHQRARWRRVTFNLSPFGSEDEAHVTFMDLMMALGLSTDFFISLSPLGSTDEQRRHTMYGAFAQIDGVTEETVGIWRSGQIIFEES